MKFVTIFLLLLVCSPHVRAEEDALQTISAPNARIVGGVTVAPYFDMYFLYNFNEPFPPNPMSGSTVVNATQPAGNNPLRFYDAYHGQFAMSLVEFTIHKAFGSTEMLLDLDFGQSAEINARQISGTLKVVDESSKNIGQAFIAWRPKDFKQLKVEIGKMSSHIGLERWKAKDNWQYSRTLMFGSGLPTWHTGLRGTYEIDASWTFGLSVYNGWNNFHDANAAKTVGATLRWRDADPFTLTYNFIGGAEQENESANQKMVHEFNAVWETSPAFSVALESLYGSEEHVMANGFQRSLATWSGWALQSRWHLNDCYELNPRIEWYNDNHGYTLGNGEQKIWSATLTQAFHLEDGLEPRLEIRYDQTNADGTFNRANASARDQFTATVALLYIPGNF